MTFNMQSLAATALLLVAIAACWIGNCADALEENTKFCIHSDPLLLEDMENQHIHPIEQDPNCELMTTTMTAKEKESFINTMCKDHGSTHKDDYFYFQLRNGELNGRGSYRSICSGKANPLLAWMPYKTLQGRFAQELNPKERKNYIAKATDVDRQKTELCHFRHSDLVNPIAENLFTCVVMIFEDNFYGLDDNINVLVEILPMAYEVRNLTYLPWVNATATYKTHLGRTVLKNPSRERKQIYGSVGYTYVEKVKVDTSSIYGEHLDKLPVLFERRDAILELDENGIGGMEVKEKTYFGRVMDPKTSVKVEAIGQWTELRKKFTGDIYEYFGSGIKRYRQDLHNGEVAITRIENSEPVFDLPESSHLATASVYFGESDKRKSQQLREGEGVSVNVSTSGHDKGGAEDFGDSSGRPYPGFYPWFVMSCIIVGAAILFGVAGMVRHCSKDEEKQKYRIAEAGP